ncbi:hypothetical protein QKY98_23590 [Pseudomonas sp. HR1]|uniref:hypothetical protein n=1 Tax=Pseudomonas sp. HR1 TaxID=1463361 RepID=UPI0025432B2C|nr:hypothetical protein [Pseudomonas sp. HR1]MDK4202113.1 hypothetical protein [Pseudomonas sp. HR1]
MKLPPEMDHPVIVDRVDLDMWADLYFQAYCGQPNAVALSDFLKQPYAYLHEAGLLQVDQQEPEYPVLLPVRPGIARQIQDEWAAEQETKLARSSARRHLTLIRGSMR